MATFTYFDGDSGLWKSDGTTQGTGPVDSKPLYPTFLTVANGLLFFKDSGPDLFRSDGTAAGTFELWKPQDLNPGLNDGPFAVDNHRLYFMANNFGNAPSPHDSAFGVGLWRTDGTVAGTTEVKVIEPDVYDHNSADLTFARGLIFFRPDDPQHGVELWESNGTTAGTKLVKDIRPGLVGSAPHDLTDVNGTLFFAANGGKDGVELWKSDGTAAGTKLVRDINPGPASSNPSGLVNLNGILLFVANDGQHGVELWRSDGTAGGTHMVKDIRSGPLGSNPSGLTVAPTFGDVLRVSGRARLLPRLP